MQTRIADAAHVAQFSTRTQLENAFDYAISVRNDLIAAGDIEAARPWHDQAKALLAKLDEKENH